MLMDPPSPNITNEDLGRLTDFEQTEIRGVAPVQSLDKLQLWQNAPTSASLF